MINFLTALLLTELVECLIVYILGIRDKYYYLAVLFINMITNPLLNYILLLIAYFGIHSGLAIELILEVFVVLSEWKMLVYVFPEGKNFFKLAIAMNAASYLIGKLILLTIS